MRHKLITSVRTRIRNKRQIVIIGFGGKECVFLSPAQIKQNTKLEVYELELLLGSTLRIDFWKKGEKLWNGKICDKDNLIVKDYFFELQKTIDLLRIENASQLLPFRKITRIFYFYKFNRDNVGIETVDGDVIFISLKRFEIQSQLTQKEQGLLIGSYIMPEYYKKGDTFPDGTPILVDNMLKWINLRYSDSIDKMREHYKSAIMYHLEDGLYEGSSMDSENDDWIDSAFDAFYEAFDGDIDAWNRHIL